jgi:uncharacterized protein
MKLSMLPGLFAMVQLPTQASIPGWALEGDFFSVTRTHEELSLVCLQANVPQGVQKIDLNWHCLKLHGPFEFSQTGVLLAVLEPLAQAQIGIFAVSTFDTDYVLVKAQDIDSAMTALRTLGHEVF